MPGDIVSDRVNELYRGEVFDPQTQRTCRDRIHWMCTQVIGNDVLDIGCSQGITALLLGREGHRVVGVDTDPAAIEYALREVEKEAEYVRRNVKFQLVGGEGLPFADESFDTVILGEILEHLTRPERLLAEAGRLLRPRGRAIITTPFGVHPHPGHVRTFYLSSFLGMVGQFFGVQSLRVVDGYITCVGVKSLPGQGEQPQDWSLEKMLLLSESAFLSKEQRHWEHRESLSRQVAALRQQAEKGRSEVEALREIANESGGRVRELEQELARGRESVAAVVTAVRDLLQNDNGAAHLTFLVDRLNRTMSRSAAGQPADLALDCVPDVLAELIRIYEGRLKQLGSERESDQAAIATLKQRHEAEVGQLRAGLDRQTAELRAAHEAELTKLREELGRKHEQELAAQRTAYEEKMGALSQGHAAALAELKQRHEAEVGQLRAGLDRQTAELRAAHEAELTKLREELGRKHEQELAAQRTAYEEKMGALSQKHAAALADLKEKRDAEVAGARVRWEQQLAELRRGFEAEMQRVREDRVAERQAYDERIAKLSQGHAAALADLKREYDTKSACLRAESEGQLARVKQAHEVEVRKLREDLQKACSRQARAEQASEQLRTRLNSLVEYYKRSDQLRLEEVRYRLGDAFVRAVDSPKDLVCLPGRFAKLIFVGLRRRRERQALEQPKPTVPSAYCPPVSSAVVMPPAVAGPVATPTPAASPSPEPAKPAPVPTGHVAIPPPVRSQLPPVAVPAGVGSGPASSATAQQAPAAVPQATPKTPSAAPSAKPPPATEILAKAPFAPHIGMGIDPKETVFPRPPAGPRRRVAIILDEFSRDCFAPEFEPVTFRPDNWANVLRTTGAEMLLVESAWHGNDGSWQYRVASYQKNMGDELLDLLACCKRNGVPTVFWNKEDPAHFDRFIAKAGLFDIVLTTDADCIPRYRERVGHDRVYALPFAAQPAIHNPIQTEPRLPKACFAGTYYATRFEQRQEDMLCLLRPAMRLGLDIFDRMHGAVGVQKDQYRFPDEFQPAIRGRLDYKDMVRTYKQYRVFLNVNSVRQSPTMFSRRVFELLACGTPVISTYAKGIEALLGHNGVFIAESEEDSQGILESLLGDRDAWALASALGIRKVLSEHTYAHRFASICRWAGLDRTGPKAPVVAVAIHIRSNADCDAAAEMIALQSYANIEAHLFASADLPKDRVGRICSAAKGRPVRCWNISDGSGDACREFLKATQAEIVCNMSPEASYADSYVDEAVMFFRIPGIDFLGKACHFGLSDGDRLQLVGSDDENRMVNRVPSATVCARRAALTAEVLRRLLTDSVFGQPDRRIFSTYRYGYVHAPARRVSGSGWRLNGQEVGSGGR